MLEGIREIFAGKGKKAEKEPREIFLHRKKIPQFLQEKHSDTFRNLEEQTENKIDRLLDNVDRIKKAVDDFRKNEKFEDNQRIKDIKKSFSRQKKHLLEFSRPKKNMERLKQFCSTLDSKLEQFSQLSPKQVFVFKQHPEAKRKIYQALDRTREDKTEFENFIDTELRKKQKIDHLRDLNSKIDDNKEKIQQTEEDISGLKQKIEREKEKLKDLRTEKEKTENSEEARNLDRLKEEIETLEEEKDRILRRGEREISRIKRVLKKFKHLADSGGISLNKKQSDNLEKLLNLDLPNTDTKNLFRQIETALRADKIDLKPKTREKFREVHRGRKIEDSKERYNSKTKELEKRKQELANFKPFLEKKKSLAEEINKKQEQIQNLKEKTAEKKEEIEKLKSENRDLVEEIYRKANELAGPLKIKSGN